jgi:hypothetical protein
VIITNVLSRYYVNVCSAGERILGEVRCPSGEALKIEG